MLERGILKSLHREFSLSILSIDELLIYIYFRCIQYHPFGGRTEGNIYTRKTKAQSFRSGIGLCKVCKRIVRSPHQRIHSIQGEKLTRIQSSCLQNRSVPYLGHDSHYNISIPQCFIKTQRILTQNILSVANKIMNNQQYELQYFIYQNNINCIMFNI